MIGRGGGEDGRIGGAGGAGGEGRGEGGGHFSTGNGVVLRE